MTPHLRRAIPLLSAALALLDAQTASAQVAPPLGVLQQFAALGGSGVTGLGGLVTGDVGSFPTCPITGFPPSIVVPPFILHGPVVCDGTVATARANATTAFLGLNQGVGTVIADQLAGQSLGPGVYTFTLGTADIAGAGGTLTLTGGPASVYVFRTASTLTANVGSIINFGAVSPCNVFWQVGSSATLNANFGGQVFASANITLGVGTNLNGRAIAGTAAVSMAGANNIGGCSVPGVVPPPVPPPPGPPGPPGPPPVPALPDIAAAGLVALLLISGTFLLGRR